MRWFAETKELKLAVRLVKDHSRRRFVQLPGLDADQPILDVVDSADTVLAAHFVDLLDQSHAIVRSAIESCRNAVLELAFHVFRLVERFDPIYSPPDLVPRGPSPLASHP